MPFFFPLPPPAESQAVGCRRNLVCFQTQKVDRRQIKKLNFVFDTASKSVLRQTQRRTDANTNSMCLFLPPLEATAVPRVQQLQPEPVTRSRADALCDFSGQLVARERVTFPGRATCRFPDGVRRQKLATLAGRGSR